MSLIETNLTKEQKQAKTAVEMGLHMVEGFKDLAYRMKQLKTYIWENPYGLTPSEAYQSHGARAWTLAQNYDAMVAFMTSAAPTLAAGLERPGTVDPVLDGEGQPTGYVTITMNSGD